MNQPYVDELAQLYDVAVHDWPGEIAFYRRLARDMTSHRASVLEVACGTGRIAVQLARSGVPVMGIDLSAEMLELAKSKSAEFPNIRWMQADMRTFRLNEQFELAIIPAYSFQLLLTEADQTSCLNQLAQHLNPGARLVLHLEHHRLDWLASLPLDTFTSFTPSGEAVHPLTGQNIRVSYAWSYEPSANTVSAICRYETVDQSGMISARTDRAALRMYCTSPFEMESLLARSGFKTEAIQGDFQGHRFHADSNEMIWVARKE